MTAIALRRPTVLPILAFGEPDQGFATHRVTSPYGPRGAFFHAAIDVGNYRAGDGVVAAAAGRVHAVGLLREPWSESSSEYGSGNLGGLMVVLRHSRATWTVYAHLRSERVTVGQDVAGGALIGEIGATGSATGAPHLHFIAAACTLAELEELRARGRAVERPYARDPWPLITGRNLLVDPSEEDDPDMPTFPAAGFRFVGSPALYRTRQGARFRAAPSLDADVLHELDAGALLRASAIVAGSVANGSPDWIATYVESRAAVRPGFVHVSAVEAVDPADPTAALRAALRPELAGASERIAAARVTVG